MTSGPRLTFDDAQRLSARRQKQTSRNNNAAKECEDGSNSSGSETSSPTKRRRPRNKKQQAGTNSFLPRIHPNRYVALDCEMVGVGPDGSRSALARVSLVDYKGQVLLDTFVKVYEKVTDYRTDVSGIKPEDLESPEAMCPSKLFPLVYQLLQNKILIGHGLENDLKLLGIPVDLLKIRDTAWYPPFMRMQYAESGILCPRKLRDLSKEYLGVDIQGKQHDSVTDARAALGLFKLVEGEWERSVIQMQCQRLVEMPRGMAIGRPTSPKRPFTTTGVALLA